MIAQSRNFHGLVAFVNRCFYYKADKDNSQEGFVNFVHFWHCGQSSGVFIVKNEYVGNFYPTYVDFCNKAGLSPSAVAEKVGLSRTAVTGWKKGKTPSYATCAKIADFFGVSVDYLLGAEQEKPAADDGDGLKFALFGGAAEKISDEALEEVLNFARYVKQKELGK